MSELVFRPQRHRRRVTLNLTSLIDVLFLLLIFFMLTSTFRRSGEIQLELPESSTSQPAGVGDEAKPTEIALRADGEVLLDGVVIDQEALVGALEQRRADNPDARVMLSAEASALHADVVKLIDLVREVGFTGLSLGTEMMATPRIGERPRDPRSEDGGN